MIRVFRFIRRKRIFFESIVLVLMLVADDGDYRHRMSRTTSRRPLIFHHKKHLRNRHLHSPREED